MKVATFYNADYGVRIQGGPDTVVAWDPEHWHGTSLQNYSPTTQVISTLNQTGLSIFTQNAFQAFGKNMMSSSCKGASAKGVGCRSGLRGLMM